MTQTIEQKLDLLAEFHAQKDLLEIDKRKLLDDVKIPAEVEAVVSDSMKAMGEIENSMRATAKTFDALIEKKLSEIIVPDELTAKLADLDRQRAELMSEFSDIEKQRAAINAKKRIDDDFLTASINVRKQELQAEIEAKTKAVYVQVAQRKMEIEAEFSGKAEDVEENIKNLETEIKAEVKAGKKSIKGKFFHAVYISGRITWNTDKMEAWIIDHPFLKDARKEGEPSMYFASCLGRYIMTKCSIIQDGNELVLSFPYDASMVADLKSSVQVSQRKPIYEGKKCLGWRVTPNNAAKIQNLCHKYFGELPFVPDIANAKPVIKQQIIEVRYIGLTKDRGSDERSAYGWHKDGWNVVFPESVLKTWFDAPQNPDEAATLYSVLCCNRDATDDEIKSGYRRMAMQWHTDYCKEPNANEQMLAINHAYEVLSKNRERYDAGLAFEMSLRSAPSVNKTYDNLQAGYRTPLRCGLIMCEGIESLGVFNVSKIFAWMDVTDIHGRVLVVSWPKGADKFEEVWA